MRQLDLFPTLPLVPPPDATPPFSVIYTDPPWLFEVYNPATTDPSRYIGNKYPIMSRDALCALPISRIVAPNCALFMWATKPNLLDAIAVLEAWGFVYTTIAWVWIKLTPRGARWNMGAGYYTRCLSGDMKIYLQDANNNVLYVPIRWLEDKDCTRYKVWSHTGWKSIIGFSKSNKETAIIQTRLGEYTSSWDHRWACKHISFPRKKDNPKLRERVHLVDYQTTSEIKRLKETFNAKKNASVNLVYSTAEVESNLPIDSIDGFELTDDLAWTLGLFVAEGNHGRKGNIRFSLHSKETNLAERVERTIASLGLYGERYINTPVVAHHHFVKGRNSLVVYASHPKIKNLIERFVAGRSAHTKRLNLELLLQTSAAFRKAFLIGIMDGDGTKCRHGESGWNGYRTLALCNQELIQDVQSLAQSLGIMSTITKPYLRKSGKGAGGYLYILQFSSPRNKDLKLDGQPVIPVWIDAIKSGETMDVYDISVEDHAFVVNGIISHNSNIEPCILGIRGSMPVSDHSILDILETEPDALIAPVREHSRKPEVAYEMIDALYPRALYPNRAEIFASPYSAPLANRHGFATPGFGSSIESYLENPT